MPTALRRTSLDPRAIATLGIGYGARGMATLGIWPLGTPAPQPPEHYPPAAPGPFRRKRHRIGIVRDIPGRASTIGQASGSAHAHIQIQASAHTTGLTSSSARPHIQIQTHAATQGASVGTAIGHAEIHFTDDEIAALLMAIAYNA